jgi:hypothetical protein
VNRWIGIFILSTVALCAGLLWLARKKRRGSDAAAAESTQPNKFAIGQPSKVEEQNAQTPDEAGVPQREAESLTVIAASPEKVAAESLPSASSLKTRIEVGAEVEGVQDRTFPIAECATPAPEAPSSLDLLHISREASSPPSAHVSSIEDDSVLIVTTNAPVPVLALWNPAPTADESEGVDDQGPVLQEAIATIQLVHGSESGSGVTAKKNADELQQPSNVAVMQAGRSRLQEAAEIIGPTGSIVLPGVSEVPPEPEESSVVLEAKPQEPPKYQALRARASVPPMTERKTPTPRLLAGEGPQLRVHIVFDRRGSSLRSLTLIPEWRAGMPLDLEVTGTHGDFALSRLGDSCEDVVLPEIGAALRSGVVWHGKGPERRWHWVLSGRELYVLSGDAGFHGFVSLPRLLLGADHVVLATIERRAEVKAALVQAGCGEPEIMDETTEGVPSGWLLFRHVKPTHSVPARDESDILNALRPVAEVEPHFVGGIQLAGRSWLFGHPPRICFTGDLGGNFEVRIDGQPANVSPDGRYTAPGWELEGRHSFWFAGRLRKYLLIRGTGHWNAWDAHDFGTGASICGPCTLPQSQACRYQVRVFVQNPVLVGAVPGQVFRCNLRADLGNKALLLYVPFAPVWALPVDDSHVNKRTARIVLAGGLQSVRRTQVKITGRSADPSIAAWCAVIKGAGRKGLPLATEEKGAVVLWREYRREAKQLWRKMR